MELWRYAKYDHPKRVNNIFVVINMTVVDLNQYLTSGRIELFAYMWMLHKIEKNI